MADEKKPVVKAAETAPDFSKIFASQSDLTPYEWQDADYLKGWNTVGSIPPARTQFDALQRTTDEKLQWLDNARQALAALIDANSKKIQTNTDNISANAGNITTNAGNITKNTEAINALKTLVNTGLTDKVSKAGDTMTGALTLPALATSDNSLKAASTKWVRDLLTSLSLISGAGVVAGDVSNANAWWVKLGGTIPLIIQGGYSANTITFPIAFSKLLYWGGFPTVNNGERHRLEWSIQYGTITGASLNNEGQQVRWLAIGLA